MSRPAAHDNRFSQPSTPARARYSRFPDMSIQTPRARGPTTSYTRSRNTTPADVEVIDLTSPTTSPLTSKHFSTRPRTPPIDVETEEMQPKNYYVDYIIRNLYLLHRDELQQVLSLFHRLDPSGPHRRPTRDVLESWPLPSCYQLQEAIQQGIMRQHKKAKLTRIEATTTRHQREAREQRERDKLMGIPVDPLTPNPNHSMLIIHSADIGSLRFLMLELCKLSPAFTRAVARLVAPESAFARQSLKMRGPPPHIHNHFLAPIQNISAAAENNLPDMDDFYIVLCSTPLKHVQRVLDHLCRVSDELRTSVAYCLAPQSTWAEKVMKRVGTPWIESGTVEAHDEMKRRLERIRNKGRGATAGASSRNNGAAAASNGMASNARHLEFQRIVKDEQHGAKRKRDHDSEDDFEILGSTDRGFRLPVRTRY